LRFKIILYSLIFSIFLMKYIVTGGAGFIGCHIVERLSKANKKVTVVDNLSTGKIENIKPFLNKINFVNVDICDRKRLFEIIEKGDIILHQAAIPSVNRSIKDPFLTNKVNVEGTLNLLLVAKEKQAKKVVFASSSSIYGDCVELPKEEKMCSNPKSPYALSKFTAETYISLFYKLYGLETVSLRYFNVFGPRQDPTSEYAAVIPKFIYNILHGKEITIYGDGKQTRDFTYVSNVVDANLLACESKLAIGQIINIASGEQNSLLDLVNELQVLLSKMPKIIYKEERKGDVKHSFAKIEKAGKLLNYIPTIGFKEGLRNTVNYFKDMLD